MRDVLVIHREMPRYAHAVSSPSQSTVFDSVRRVLLEMAQMSDLNAVLPWLVSRLADSCVDTAAVAIWEVSSAEACTVDAYPEACATGEECLHLVALATRSAGGTVVTSNPDLERALRRLPLAALDSQGELPRFSPPWDEDGRRWLPLRLAYRQKLAGVMGFWLRGRDDLPGPDASSSHENETLQLLANQLASLLANERAREEIRRLQHRLEESQGMPRPAPGTAVVSEADIRRFERSNIAAALEATGGRVYGRGGAAELLGLKPTTLASRLKKLGFSSRT